MDILDRIRQRAASRPQHIVLPEGNDPRTVVAAAEATSQRIARITVLGDEETIRSIARDNRVDLGGVSIIDHKRAADFDKVVALFHDLRRAKGLIRSRRRFGCRRDEHNESYGSGGAALYWRAIRIQARVELLFDGAA